MKNTVKNNHQETRKSAGSKIGLGLVNDVFYEKYGVTSDFAKNHGVSAFAVKNLSYSSRMVEHPVKTSLMALIGFNPLSLAVRMMVIMIETLRFPRSVVFPKVIFRNKTAFLIPCSAELFVGETAGYFRKVKSSFLNVIKRLRMLSDSLCDNGACRYNFRNLFRISFLPERYSSEVSSLC